MHKPLSSLNIDLLWIDCLIEFQNLFVLANVKSTSSATGITLTADTRVRLCSSSVDTLSVIDKILCE